MAAYDPRVYQMHTAGAGVLHPGMMPGMPGMSHQRFPHHGNNVPPPSSQQGGNLQPPQSAVHQAPRQPSADKQKAGPGWQHTYRMAQSIAFPEPSTACGERVAGFLEDLARAIGCPVEYVLVPLLPCIGGLLGTNTTIRVHRGWSEPPILWSVVSASAGTRRSAVIRQLLSPILALQRLAPHERKSSSPSNRTASGNDSSNNSDGESASEEDMSSFSKGPAAKRHRGSGARSEKSKPVESKPGPPRRQRRALYSGTRINAAALTEVLHRNDGHAFSLTENVENLHEMLGLLQPVVPPRLVSVMEDLYEGLPLVAVEDGRVTTILGSNFCHGGFASSEYAVTLMLKCPSWLSARLLLSCPQTDDMKGVFGEPAQGAHQPDLGFIYETILRHHEEKNTYTFNQDAVQELSRFFDDEWSTVLNQLDQNEHEGIIGKSMGQIVRISSVLKALDNSVRLCENMETNSESPPEWDWVIDPYTVKCAITLGKYFLEQKLAMTFMVGTGFFTSSAMESSMNGGSDNNSFQDSMTLPQTALGESSMNDQLDSQAGSSQQTPHSSASSSPHGAMVPGRSQRTGSQDSMPSISQVVFGAQATNQQALSLYDLPKPPGPEGDVDYKNLPHTMTTLEEDVSEMMQAVDFVHFSKTQFVAVHGRRIKRLLECYDDGHGVSATTAAQKSITPPVRIEGTNNRHPAWASALFFQKVADLQLGSAEQGRHPTNRKVCWRFKRKPLSQLNEKDFQLLNYLRVDMEKYSQFGSSPLNPTMMVNCGLISLNQNNSPGPSQRMPAGLDEDSSSQPSAASNSSTPNIKSEVF
ncbi:uncharacterized protein LOC101853843 [Aplysia californica]|uniref:Uncharacterized protein LOC101853843 n=1 Tax=Aplysia californica TaxID=6500 RepID=A0ABM0JIF3_APLCA|nr:uncharacterized protein LOC101853843 [Aplysia californica]